MNGTTLTHNVVETTRSQRLTRATSSTSGERHEVFTINRESFSQVADGRAGEAGDTVSMMRQVPWEPSPSPSQQRIFLAQGNP